MIVRSPMRSFVGFITILTNGTDQQKKDGLFFPSNRSQCMTIMHKSSEYRAALPEHLQHGYSNIHHYWVECAEATLRDTLILWRPLCENKLEMASITRGLHLSFVRRLFAARASCLDFPYSTLPDTRLSVTDDHTLVEYAQRKPWGGRMLRDMYPPNPRVASRNPLKLSHSSRICYQVTYKSTIFW
jgi:hypothetical protein